MCHKGKRLNNKLGDISLNRDTKILTLRCSNMGTTDNIINLYPTETLGHPFKRILVETKLDLEHKDRLQKDIQYIKLQIK